MTHYSFGPGLLLCRIVIAYLYCGATFRKLLRCAVQCSPAQNLYEYLICTVHGGTSNQIVSVYFGKYTIFARVFLSKFYDIICILFRNCVKQTKRESNE